MPLKIARRTGNELVDAVARATELGPLPSIPRLPARDGTGGFDDDQLELFERFKEWRKVKAQELEMDSSLVLNRHTLLKLATTRATNPRELVAIDGLLDWQVEWFGKELLAVQRAFEADLAAGRVERPRGRGRRV
jgi:superfamily II DNA helicase RecQ